MKTPILKPGFEFIFALSLMAILGLPPMLMAQDQKDVEIKITNGDTTVNGRNIKDLPADERRSALRDIKHLSGDDIIMKRDGRRHVFVMRDSIREHDGMLPPPMNGDFVVKIDSAGNNMEMRMNRRMRDNSDDGPGGPSFKGRMGRDPMREPMMGFAKKNTQSLSYVSTDNNGISTRISFRISDVTNEDLRRMPHVEGSRLGISDLNLVPEFSTGKTLLVFTLPAKTASEVKLVDSEGKILWSEKSVGTMFTKSFVIGLNGVYYLQVTQGGSVAVKRILKEE